MIKTKPQQGFTLIELLVSMGLGIFFLSVATSFLLSSRIAYSTQDVNARLQENARFALDEMSSAIRMAAYVDLMTKDVEVPIAQFYTGQCAGFDPCTADGAAGSPDRFAVLLNPPPDDGTDADCVGAPLDPDTETAAISLAAYLYMIGDDNGVSSLMCQTFLIDEDGVSTAVNANPQVLVNGVDDLQLLYGVTDVDDVSDYNTKIQRYVNGTTVDSLATPNGALTPWVDIAAVRVGVLVGSGLNDTDDTAASRSYSVLDAPAQTFTDQARRQVFTTTVTINNARN